VDEAKLRASLERYDGWCWRRHTARSMSGQSYVCAHVRADGDAGEMPTITCTTAGSR
jgi:hypothetical protein